MTPPPDSESRVRTRVDERRDVIVRATQINLQHERGPKPIGFWYSVDGDWERWCREESPHWLNGQQNHVVTLGSENILHLNGVGDIDVFHLRYANQSYINWRKVAAEYDGIEIAPYVWERRLAGDASQWYYGWDCASGCIWTPRGVRVELATEVPHA